MENSTKAFWDLRNETKDNITKGRLNDALKNLFAAFKVHRNSEMAMNSAGWLVVQFMWQLQKNQETLKNYKANIPAIISLLQNIKFSKARTPYSALYNIFAKLSDENSQWFLNFAKSFGLESFADEDFRTTRYQTEDGENHIQKPLVVSVIFKLAKIITSMPEENRLESIEWFEPHFLRIGKKLEIEKSPNDAWIFNYYRAKFLIIRGEKEESRELLFNVLKTKQREFWVWSLIGETFLGEDDELALSFLSKAVMLGKDDKMLLGVRLTLAKLFMQFKMFDHAKTEAENVFKFKRELGYKIPLELKILRENENLGNASIIELKEYYSEKSKIAVAKVNENYPKATGIVVGTHNEKPWAFIYFDFDKTARYVLKKGEKLSIGEVVEIHYSEGYNSKGERKYNAISLEVSDKFPNDNFVKAVKGNLTIPEGKNFGFVEDAYVSRNIIETANLISENNIEGIAIKETNIRNGKVGWKLITANKGVTDKEIPF